MKRSFIVAVKNLAISISMLIMPLISATLAGSYYISTIGNDRNNGSISSPWRTVMQAWENSGGGDTVFVRDGTYTENEMWLHMSTQGPGKENQFWTLKSYPGEKARFTNAKIVIDDNYVRIQGLTFDAGGSQEYSLMYVRCTEGIREYVEILDNLFTGRQTDVVLEFTANNGLVQGNTVNITSGSTSHGIYIKHGSNNIIRNNFVTGMEKYGIHIYDENKYSHYTAIKNYIIENNVVVGSKSRSGIIIGSGSADGIIPIDGVVVRNNLIINNSERGIYIYKKGDNKNIEIYNNTIYGNGGDGIYIPSGSNTRDVSIKNNIFAQNGFNIRIDNVDNLIVSHNLYYQPSSVGNGAIDDTPIYKDPLFVNADDGDFHLKKNSPAIDAGVDVGIVYNGNAPDLGAFESGLSSSSEKQKNGTKPTGIILHQNYPNPFNPSTEICYNLSLAVDIDLSIFDISGRLVKTLVHGLQSAGPKTIIWDSSDNFSQYVSSGVYFCRLKAGEFSDDKRMLLVR
jgi:hypothetical protein